MKRLILTLIATLGFILSSNAQEKPKNSGQAVEAQRREDYRLREKREKLALQQNELDDKAKFDKKKKSYKKKKHLKAKKKKHPNWKNGKRRNQPALHDKK